MTCPWLDWLAVLMVSLQNLLQLSGTLNEFLFCSLTSSNAGSTGNEQGDCYNQEQPDVCSHQGHEGFVLGLRSMAAPLRRRAVCRRMLGGSCFIKCSCSCCCCCLQETHSCSNQYEAWCPPT